MHLFLVKYNPFLQAISWQSCEKELRSWNFVARPAYSAFLLCSGDWLFPKYSSMDSFLEKTGMGELLSGVKCVPYVTLRSFTHPHDLTHSKMSVAWDRVWQTIVLLEISEERPAVQVADIGKSHVHVNLCSKKDPKLCTPMHSLQFIKLTYRMFIKFDKRLMICI
jgi:hypothetical protein